MKKLLQVTGVLAVSALSVHGQEAAPADPPVKAEENADIRAIIREFDEQQNATAKKLRAAKSDEERREAAKGWNASGPFAERIMEIVRKNPDDAQAVRGLMWVAMRGPKDLKGQATELLLKDYKDHTDIKSYAAYLGRGYEPGAEKKLRSLMEASSSKEIQRVSQMYLATMLSKKSERLSEADKAKAMNEEALALLRAVVKSEKEDPVNPRLLASAERKLFKLEHLSIGCEAPEIVGTDQDGKEFKLSDYRGKVVLIDFWGHW